MNHFERKIMRSLKIICFIKIMNLNVLLHESRAMIKDCIKFPVIYSLRTNIESQLNFGEYYVCMEQRCSHHFPNE